MFQHEKGNWMRFRGELPDLIDCDFHHGQRQPSLGYGSVMAQVVLPRRSRHSSTRKHMDTNTPCFGMDLQAPNKGRPQHGRLFVATTKIGDATLPAGVMAESR